MKFIDDLKIYYNSEQSFQKIIFWNVALAIIFLILRAYYTPAFQFIIDWFSLSGNDMQSILKPWTFVTYSFLHADFFHLLSNIIMLYFSSRLFYTYFTNNQFLTVYFLGVIFSGIIYAIVSLLFNNSSVLVGASAGILAVLFTLVSYNPHLEVRLLLLGNVRLWMIGAVLILFFVIQIPSSNFGGHIAHFAGAFFGFIYAKLLLNGYDISAPLFNFFDIFSSKKVAKKGIKNTPFKKVYYTPSSATNSANFSQLENQKRINDILDKISNSGYDSLTTDEKNFLFKAGKN